jgi:hypothetical protein
MGRPSKLEALVGEYLILRAKLAELRGQIEAELRFNPNPKIRVFLERFSPNDREILLDILLKGIEEKEDVIEVPEGVGIPEPTKPEAPSDEEPTEPPKRRRRPGAGAKSGGRGPKPPSRSKGEG